MLILIHLFCSLLISHYPTILVHGIGGDAADLVDLHDALETQNIEVYSLQIGNGKLDSIIWNINKQCAHVNTSIAELRLSAEKINVLGISQGGLLARCYVERYAHLNKRVNSLITYGSPHMGIYTSWVNLPSLEYWKDPYEYAAYLQSNDFLVFINNEKQHYESALYKSNLLSLNHFLIVWSHIDKVISPMASSRFEFYNISLARERKELQIVSLEKTESYLEDRLGLRTLMQENKLIIEEFACEHEQFKHPDCFNNKFVGKKLSLMNLTVSIL